jgi:hypothetical protein
MGERLPSSRRSEMVMLSRWEHRSLSEIEHGLELEDPELAMKLSRTRVPSPRGRWGWVPDVAVGVAALLSALAVLVGAYCDALGMAVIAGVLAWFCYGSSLTRPAMHNQQPGRTESQPGPRRLEPPTFPPDNDTRL